MKKICSKCGVEKSINYFYVNKAYKGGFTRQCKSCSLEKSRRWNKSHKSSVNKAITAWKKRNSEKVKKYKQINYKRYKKEILAKNKQWCENNRERKNELERKRRASLSPEKKRAISKKTRQWQRDNREKINKRFIEKWANDPKFRLSKLMSSKIRQSLKGGKNWKSWEVLVGYTKDALIRHLKRTIKKPYCWDDYLSGRIEFHIDHKTPISVFNFDSYENPDFKRCWALSNLQLIPAQDNLKKGATIDKHFQPNLLLAF